MRKHFKHWVMLPFVFEQLNFGSSLVSKLFNHCIMITCNYIIGRNKGSCLPQSSSSDKSDVSWEAGDLPGDWADHSILTGCRFFCRPEVETGCSTGIGWGSASPGSTAAGDVLTVPGGGFTVRTYVEYHSGTWLIIHVSITKTILNITPPIFIFKARRWGS